MRMQSFGITLFFLETAHQLKSYFKVVNKSFVCEIFYDTLPMPYFVMILVFGEI